MNIDGDSTLIDKKGKRKEGKGLQETTKIEVSTLYQIRRIFPDWATFECLVIFCFGLLKTRTKPGLNCSRTGFEQTANIIVFLGNKNG